MPTNTAAKQPQDRLPKVVKKKPSTVYKSTADHFIILHDGEEFPFNATAANITPGFVRKNRASDAEFAYSALELLATPEALEVFDNLSHKDAIQVINGLSNHIRDVLGVELGE